MPGRRRASRVNATVPRRRGGVLLEELPDGTAVLADGSGGAFALNPTAVAVWELCDGARTVDDIGAALLERYDAPAEVIQRSVVDLLAHLRKLGVLERTGEPAAVGAADLSFRSRYDLLGFRVEVLTDSADFRAMLDRLNVEFLDSATGTEQPDASYRARQPRLGQAWDLTYLGQKLRRRSNLEAAVGHVEWHMVTQAIERRHDLLHVHGAALAGPEGSVLMPGDFGIGKTTFALALSLKGLRLLADDVVFIHLENWRPEPFPRSFLIRDGTLELLGPLGLRYEAKDRIGPYLCPRVLGPWSGEAGPPLRYVLFPRFRSDGPLSLQPITHAEAAVELMRYSRNLRRFPRFGLDLIPRLLSQVECYVLERNDDLTAAAELVTRLVKEGRA